MARLLGTAGNIDTLTVGGRTFTDVSSNLIELAVAAQSATQFGTARKLNASSGYAVTAGKTLTIYAARITIITAGSGAGLNLLYGSSDVGMGSGSTPSGVFYMAGSTTSTLNINQNASLGYQEFAVNFSVGSGLFPGILINGGSVSGILFGYEV